MLTQGFSGIADFTFTREEYQNIAGAVQRQLIDRIDNRIHQIALLFAARSAGGWLNGTARTG